MEFRNWLEAKEQPILEAKEQPTTLVIKTLFTVNDREKRDSILNVLKGWLEGLDFYEEGSDELIAGVHLDEFQAQAKHPQMDRISEVIAGLRRAMGEFYSQGLLQRGRLQIYFMTDGQALGEVVLDQIYPIRYEESFAHRRYEANEKN